MAGHVNLGSHQQQHPQPPTNALCLFLKTLMIFHPVLSFVPPTSPTQALVFANTLKMHQPCDCPDLPRWSRILTLLVAFHAGNEGMIHNHYNNPIHSHPFPTWNAPGSNHRAQPAACSLEGLIGFLTFVRMHLPVQRADFQAVLL